MSKRWEDDDRGRGVANAARLVPGARELIAAFSEPDWVAEQPEVHLRPHVDEWCRHDRRLALGDAHADESDGFILDLQWRGQATSVGEVRAAVFSLVGSFAESATYIRQRRVPSDGDQSGMRLQFEVGTGELAPDTRFAPHGHVVVINVAGVR
jgi:hypothetical protein